ncbi:hypothetical protein OROMI_001125 [Orobanche minor]
MQYAQKKSLASQVIPDIVLVESEDESTTHAMCDPEAPSEDILKFLFDEKLDSRSTIVNFGTVHMNRSAMRSLQPNTNLIDSVIDCVAHMCLLDHKESKIIYSYWFFSSIFAEYVIRGKYNDEDLRDLFINGDTQFQLEVHKLEKLYLPINDTKGRFVAIIEFDLLNIIICDTKPNNIIKAFRKDLVIQLVNKLGDLLGMGKMGNFYTYQYPTWVPNQENGYDCGLYVCLIMMFDEDVNKKLTKVQSDLAR